jgi:hypothetical protein
VNRACWAASSGFEPGTVSYRTVRASLREHFIYVPGSAGSAGPS